MTKMMARSVAVAALASGAAAFITPLPTPAVRLAGAMAGVSGATRQLHHVLPARSRIAPRAAPLRLAMHDEHSMELKKNVAVEKVDSKQVFANSLSKVVVLSALSTLFFSGAAFAAPAALSAAPAAVGWWSDAKLWGFMGAIAGWGMSLAAIKDAATSGPEIISENMTFVMLIYSTLFAWWAWVVDPRNMLLCACHVANILAQSNQARRLVGYMLANGQGKEVTVIAQKALAVAVGGAAAVVGGPIVQGVVSTAGMGALSTIAASKAGPFTVHFWAPMSKWLISGASFLDLNRPTDKISIAQYSALTFTGLFFTRYALLVSPINYVLCSVNIALFLSSAWQLGRKIKADYL